MAGGFDFEKYCENQLEEYKAERAERAERAASAARAAAEFRTEHEKRGAMFKYGHLHTYLRKWPNEDKMDDMSKRYFKQVRESNGYDVDCTPAFMREKISIDTPMISCFYPYKKHELLFDDEIQEIARDGLKIINKQLKPSGERYELVRIKRGVHVAHRFTLFTLRVKDVEDSSLQTLRVCVFVPLPFQNKEFGVEEWKLLPSDGNEQKEEEEAEKEEPELRREKEEAELRRKKFEAKLRRKKEAAERRRKQPDRACKAKKRTKYTDPLLHECLMFGRWSGNDV